MKVSFIKRDTIKMKIRLFVNNVDNKPLEVQQHTFYASYYSL